MTSNNFIKHHPCPKCGSKDNLAEYNDHFWCFGCKYHKLKDDLDSVRSRLASRDDHSVIKESINGLETTTEIPIKPLKWILSFGITLKEILDNKIAWNTKEQLLVLLQSKDYWQARCFGNQRVKYMSRGKKPLTIYGNGDTIVLVEDILSAIKIARLSPEYCSSPLLGCSMPKEAIQSLKERFSSVVVWLDRDKAFEAVKLAKQFRELGFSSKIVITKEDPKELTKEIIFECLKNS